MKQFKNLLTSEQFLCSKIFVWHTINLNKNMHHSVKKQKSQPNSPSNSWQQTSYDITNFKFHFGHLIKKNTMRNIYLIASLLWKSDQSDQIVNIFCLPKTRISDCPYLLPLASWPPQHTARSTWWTYLDLITINATK